MKSWWPLIGAAALTVVARATHPRNQNLNNFWIRARKDRARERLSLSSSPLQKLFTSQLSNKFRFKIIINKSSSKWSKETTAVAVRQWANQYITTLTIGNNLHQCHRTCIMVGFRLLKVIATHRFIPFLKNLWLQHNRVSLVCLSSDYKKTNKD